METKYRNKITYLSFILSILVIMIHATNYRTYEIYHGPVYLLEYIIENIASFAVPIFFTISGYLFFRNYTPSSCRRKLIARFKTIFIPFLIWGLLYALVFSGIRYIPMLKNYINTQTTFWRALFNTFILGERTHLWYLRNLIVYILTAPVMFYLLYFRCFPIAYILVMTILHRLLNEGIYSLTMNSIFFYTGGWLVIHCKSSIERDYTIRSKIIATIGAVVLLASSCIFRYPYELRCVFILTCIPMIWIMTDFLKSENRVHYFVYYSFFIYVSHVLILEVIQKLIFFLVPHNDMLPL